MPSGKIKIGNLSGWSTCSFNLQDNEKRELLSTENWRVKSCKLFSFPPFCDSFSILDFRALKPDVTRGTCEGSLDNSKEATVKLSNLKETTRMKQSCSLLSFFLFHRLVGVGSYICIPERRHCHSEGSWRQLVSYDWLRKFLFLVSFLDCGKWWQPKGRKIESWNTKLKPWQATKNKDKTHNIRFPVWQRYEGKKQGN